MRVLISEAVHRRQCSACLCMQCVPRHKRDSCEVHAYACSIAVYLYVPGHTRVHAVSSARKCMQCVPRHSRDSCDVHAVCGEAFA